MVYDVFVKDFIMITHWKMNLIDGYISSYWSVIKSPKQLDMIKQGYKLSAVLGDIESDLLIKMKKEKIY